MVNSSLNKMHLVSWINNNLKDKDNRICLEVCKSINLNKMLNLRLVSLINKVMRLNSNNSLNQQGSKLHHSRRMLSTSWATTPIPSHNSSKLLTFLEVWMSLKCLNNSNNHNSSRIFLVVWACPNRNHRIKYLSNSLRPNSSHKRKLCGMRVLAQTCLTSTVYSHNRLSSSKSSKCQTCLRISPVLQVNLGALLHSQVETASGKTIKWTTWTSRPADSSLTSTGTCFWILWTLVWITLAWTGSLINSSSSRWCSKGRCK